MKKGTKILISFSIVLLLLLTGRLFGIKEANAAAPAVRAVGAVQNGQTPQTPGMPAGVLTGDILILICETPDETTTISGGTETWAHVSGSPVTGAAGVDLAVFWARASQDAPTSPTTFDPADHILCRMIAFSGASSIGDPVDVTNTSTEASDNSISYPAVTTNVGNTMIVNAFAGDGPDGNSTANCTNPVNASLGSPTERMDNRVNSGNGGVICMGTGTLASAGGSGNTTSTLSNVAVKAMLTLAILPEMTTTQNDFEFWEDNDGLTPATIWGTPDIAENTALDAVPPGNDPIDPADEIRLRMNISVSTEALKVSTRGYILAYTEAQDCTTASGWTDVDVGGGAGTWRYASSTVTDATTLTTLLVSTSDVDGRYVKVDPTTTNPNAVSAGQEMEWDFHVEYNGAASAATYCFRIENQDGSTLSAYNADSYPRVDTRPGPDNFMRHGKFFSTGVNRGFFWTH